MRLVFFGVVGESLAADNAQTHALKHTRANSKTQACADGGAWSARAAELLAAAGYGDVVRIEGGYAAWRRVFSTCGRRRPAGGGRWVPTGTEALKSGLPIPGVADRYEDVNPV